MSYSDLSSLITREIAETQGEIFLYAKKTGLDTVSFAKAYMKSEFCNKEMDSVYSYFHGKPDTVCFSCLKDEAFASTITEGAASSSLSDPYWVGAVYRYLVLLTGIPSKKIVDIIPPGKLDDLSIAYEGLEIEAAAKDIVKKSLFKAPQQLLFY